MHSEHYVVEVVRLVETHKAKLAFLAPFVAAVGTALASWIVSGDFNATEIRTALGGTVLSVFASAGAFLGSPGTAVVDKSKITSLP